MDYLRLIEILSETSYKELSQPMICEGRDSGLSYTVEDVIFVGGNIIIQIKDIPGS